MMQGPLIWLMLLALLAGTVYFIWRRRSRRVVLDIQHIPAARLDNTPERSEILGEVKVRSRDAAAESVAPAQRATAAAKVRPREEPPAALTQTDMFPAASEKAAAKPVRRRKREPEPEPEPVVAPSPDVVMDASRVLPAETVTVAVQAVPPGMTRVLSLHVLARGRGFAGQALLELLLQYGLRFGDMQIFHRHEKPNGQGGVLFSLARSHEPGTFVPEQMSRELIGGISLFMSLPGCQSLVAFDLMVDTARRIAKELDGDLFDEFSQAIQPSQLDSWRDLVVNHERQRLSSQ